MEFNLVKGGHADLKRIFPAMGVDFARYELPPRLVLHAALLQKRAELLLLKDEERMEYGYAYCMVDGSGCVLPSWLAVYPTLRGKGAGEALLAQMTERYADKECVIIEVAEGKPESGRLREFYKKAGYEITDVPYALGGHPYTLMCRQPHGGAKLNAYSAGLIIRRLYMAFGPLANVDRYVKIG